MGKLRKVCVRRSDGLVLPYTQLLANLEKPSFRVMMIDTETGDLTELGVERALAPPDELAESAVVNGVKYAPPVTHEAPSTASPVDEPVVTQAPETVPVHAEGVINLFAYRDMTKKADIVDFAQQTFGVALDGNQKLAELKAACDAIAESAPEE